MSAVFRSIALACAAVLAAAAPAAARVAPKPWPPATGPGQLFAHFGEEHVNDDDGPTLFPKAVEQAARYKPALVTLSGDKAEDGEEEQFKLWSDVMRGFDAARVPYLAAAGNHDRTAPPGSPGGTVGLFEATTPESFEVYKHFFADRPYPWGDAAPYPGIGPAQRPADDPEGAAATYVADIGEVRWIFLDNSCWSLSSCDNFQARADGGGGTQFEFLREKATEGAQQGKLVFVVMHIPTRDPRDQEHTSDVTTRQHIMGKGFQPRDMDNDRFEEIAAETGVDAVFVAHIKGQFLYRGQGDIPYFIDGGVGGELYTNGPIGTDHGYWHGYRLIRVHEGRIVTDAVPFFVEDGIRIEGPDHVARGAEAQWAAFGKQPVFKDPAKVERLELRDPDPTPKDAGGRRAAWLVPVAMWAGPFLLLFGFIAMVNRTGLLRRGRRPALAGLAGFVAISGLSAVAVAQQEVPTATPRDALPTPARIWTSHNPRVLAPIPAEADDPRRNRATQTVSGKFVARCPGRTTIDITSGWEQTRRAVTVPSGPGRLTRSVRRGARVVSRGRIATVARVRPAQPVVVRVRVKRGRRTVRTLAHGCTSRPVAARWNGSGARRGRYTLEVAVFSERRPQIRRYGLRVR